MRIPVRFGDPGPIDNGVEPAWATSLTGTGRNVDPPEGPAGFSQAIEGVEPRSRRSDSAAGWTDEQKESRTERQALQAPQDSTVPGQPVSAHGLGAAPGPADQEEPKPETAGPTESDWKDRYLRLAADFDNYRKRSRREEEQARRQERSGVLSSWLEVLDSTERALESTNDRRSPWYQGFEAIYRQMLQVLGAHGVKRLETDGQPFDPHLHEAIAAAPGTGLPKGTIVKTDRAGFVFDDGEVLRPARVVVAQ